MELRPLADRIRGVDDVACELATGLDDTAVTALRFVLADIVRRHGELLDYFSAGGQEVLVCSTGLVTTWPDDPTGDGFVVDGFPRWGVEELPVVAAALAAVPDGERTAVVDAASVVAERARALGDSEDLAGAVCAGYCDTIILAALDDPR